MELRQLEYFLQICKSGSLSKAKEHLGVTQPTLSQQIRVLEDEYNIPLFNRVSRGVELTEAGKILLNKGNAIMNLLEEARNKIFDHVTKETLTIGCCPAEMEYLAPTFLAFHQKHPNAQLKIIEAEDVELKLLEHGVDIGITSKPISDRSVVATHLYRQEMALLLHASHPIANKASIPFRALKQLNSIMFRGQYKSLIEMHGFSCGFTLESMIETTSTSLLIHWVQQGHGAALLPNSLLRNLNDNSLRIVRIEGQVPSWDISLAHLNSMTMRSTAQAFIQEMNQCVRVAETG